MWPSTSHTPSCNGICTCADHSTSLNAWSQERSNGREKEREEEAEKEEATMTERAGDHDGEGGTTGEAGSGRDTGGNPLPKDPDRTGTGPQLAEQQINVGSSSLLPVTGGAAGGKGNRATEGAGNPATEGAGNRATEGAGNLATEGAGNWATEGAGNLAIEEAATRPVEERIRGGKVRQNGRHASQSQYRA